MQLEGLGTLGISLMKALIIDDEPFVRDDLRHMLSEFPDIEVIGEAATIREATELLSRTRPDVVFLDIQLRGGGGFELLPFINQKSSIIMFTAHNEYLEKALETNAVDCIPKPVTAGRLA